MIGLGPANLPLGAVLPGYATDHDVLLIEPLLFTTMSLTNLLEFLVPLNAPPGASIYTQGLRMNPWAFPNDPIKLSQAIEWQVGATNTSDGNHSGLTLWPTSSPLIMAGVPRSETSTANLA